MPVTATCINCERIIELSIENQWFDSGDNYLCGDGPRIGHPHAPAGSTIGREAPVSPLGTDWRKLADKEAGEYDGDTPQMELAK